MLKQLIFTLIVTLGCSALLFAQKPNPNPTDLSQYRWEKRIVLIFTPNSTNTMYQNQLRTFLNHRSGFEERDLITFQLFGKGKGKLSEQTLSSENVQELYRQFGIGKNEFTVILIGKDGSEKLRTTDLLPVRKLFSVIDAMPMRQRELKNRPN